MATARKPRNPTAAVVGYARDRHGWTQQDLAERLHAKSGDPLWNRKRVHRLESGVLKVDVDMLQLLADVLQLDVGTLVYGVGRPPPSAGVTTGYPPSQGPPAGRRPAIARRHLLPAFAALPSG